ncbi:MAG: bifunctional DNA primase/polymerase [Pseudomonadota bacterium]
MLATQQINDKVLNTALAYARKGVLVFPCNPATKGPLITGGFTKASCDLDQVAFWFRRKHPGAMIGAATGRRSGFWAVDLDLPKHDGEAPGSETWAALLEEHGGAPRTATLRTPSGGTHLYWRWPLEVQLGDRDIRNSQKNRLGDGVDTRAEGGYVILPPSRRADGRAYEWVRYGARGEETPLVHAPDWLLDLAATPTPEAAAAAAAQGLAEQASATGPRYRRARVDRGAAPAYATNALNDEINKLARTPKGRRGAQLNESAFSLGQLVAGGLLPASLVIDQLHAGARLNGLLQVDGAKEVSAKIRRGMEAGAAFPRTAPRAPLAARQPAEAAR